MTHGSPQKGFTLVEVTMVLIIGGTMIVMPSVAALNYMKQTRISTTQERMQEIQDALEHYVAVNGFFPGPASLTAPPDSLTYGTAIDCFSGAVAGTYLKFNQPYLGIPTSTAPGALTWMPPGSWPTNKLIC